jgi:hypothetical protein
MYNVRNKQKLNELNTKINDLFDKKDPFSVVRIGNMEGYFLETYDKGEDPLDEFFYWLTLTSGVFPHSKQYLTQTWSPINHDAMIAADILGFVDVSGTIEKNESFKNKYCKNGYTFFGVDDILVLDPGYLINKEIVDVPCPDPWTKKLKGKKVLVVSAFVESIKEQWKNKESIWGDSLEKICPFELVDVIRSPFHPQMDNRQFLGCDTWDKSLQYLMNQIDTYEYDVLLVSAAAMAPALANHAKRKGKIGITVCGTLQLFFGILGARWTGNHRSYVTWAKMFNEHWKYPLDVDRPQNEEIFNRFEKAYWK